MTTISLGTSAAVSAVSFSGSGSGLTGIPAGTALTGQVGIGNGGTGQASANAAYNALSPNTTEGDLTYFHGGVNARLATGGANTFLTSNATDPAWNALNVGTGLTGNAVSSALAIANSGVTAATYYAPQVTYNAQGQATNAVNILTTAGDLLTDNGTNPVRLGVGTNGQALYATSGSATGLNWMTQLMSMVNAGISTSVAANALTVTMTGADGSTAISSSSPGIVAFRNSTATTGGVSLVTVTSAPTITIPSGTTIGTSNNYGGFIYVYAMNNAGTVILAVSLSPFALDALATSSAISGGASATTLYTTAAHASLPIQYMGKFLAPQATAGTWASGSTEVWVATGYDYAAAQIVAVEGDLLTVNASSLPARLAVGGANTFLTSNGVLPSWNALNVGTGLTGNAVSSALAIANSGVTAATYYAPQVTFNAQGQATSALSPLTTAGDLLVYTSASNTPARFGIGTNGLALIANSGNSGGFGMNWMQLNINTINVGFKTAVSANAMTISLTQADGSTSPANSSFVVIPNRGQVAPQVGSVITYAVTTALSITIPSGTTIGTVNNDTRFIYLYAVNPSGVGSTLVLGLSLLPFALDAPITTVSIAGGSSATTLYTTAGAAGSWVQYIGKFTAPQTAAGTWAAVASEACVYTGLDYAAGAIQTYGTGFTASWTQSQSVTNSAFTTVLANNLGTGTTFVNSWGALNTGTGVYTCPVAGQYSASLSVFLGATSFATELRIDQNANTVAYNAIPSGAIASSNATSIASFKCAAGDAISFLIFQTSGSTQTMTAIASIAFIGLA